MNKLLIIADDFTGALDTGIQFTKMGIRARIVTEYDYDFNQLKEGDALLSVNTDTRPLSTTQAYDRVFCLASNARNFGFRYAYKKTDSGLRGNIGMELKAVMDAYEQNVIAFIPALPRLNRITRGGVQYIEGIPVSESVFGKDPFEPVLQSDVADIIRSQTDLNVVKVPVTEYENVCFEYEEPTVVLFDAETEEDLLRIAVVLRERDQTRVIAGCAGFAAAYEKILTFEKGRPHYMQLSDGLIALSGSVNQITVDQINYAKKHGFDGCSLANEEKLMGASIRENKALMDELYRLITSTDRFILDTLDIEGSESVAEYAKSKGLTMNDVRRLIPESLGAIAIEMVERGLNYTFSMTGGDTLMGFMEGISRNELVPLCEVGKGAVLSALRWNGKRIQVISKSGGFGEESIFLNMYDRIMHPFLKEE